VPVRFDRVDLIGRLRVEGNVEAGACGDLEDTTGHALHHASPLVADPHPFGGSEHGVVDAGEDRVVHATVPVPVWSVARHMFVVSPDDRTIK